MFRNLGTEGAGIGNNNKFSTVHSKIHWNHSYKESMYPAVGLPPMHISEIIFWILIHRKYKLPNQEQHNLQAN